MRLRALEPEDIEFLYDMENDTSLWWVGAQTAPVSMYHLRDYIANNENDIFKDEQVRFVIEISSEEYQGIAGNKTAERHVAIGLIDLFAFSPLHNRAELGIALHKDFHGFGLAQQAISMVADIARNIIHLNQIYAIVPASHAASIQMLEKSHFVCGGRLSKWLFDGKNYHDAKIMQLFLQKY